MDLIENPTQPSAAEITVTRMQSDGAHALLVLKRATVDAFRATWYPLEDAPANLAVMGTKAVANFARHARTVAYLLEMGVEMDAADYTPPVAYTEHEDGRITLEE